MSLGKRISWLCECDDQLEYYKFSLTKDLPSIECEILEFFMTSEGAPKSDINELECSLNKISSTIKFNVD